MPRRKKEQNDLVPEVDNNKPVEAAEETRSQENTSASDETTERDETNIQDELWAIEESSIKKQSEETENEDEDHEDSSTSEVRVSPISDKMLTLMDSAIFRKEILTGELVGVRRTRMGVIANVIYNNDVNSLDFDSVTVQISGDEMGLNEEAIERFIRERARGRGERISASQIRQRKARYQAAMLNSMLGCTVDFIPTQIHEDTKAVIGSRAMAMEERRKAIPRDSRNRLVQSRVLRVNPVQLIVEVSGYEVTMSPSQLTPMAVDFTKFFSPGDTFRVRIVEMTENGPSVVSPTLKRIDVESRVLEYKRGDVVKGTLYYYFPRSGKFYARMPNGCRAEIYYESSTLRTNPHVGDNVRLLVRGYSPGKTHVRCKINSIIK